MSVTTYKGCSEAIKTLFFPNDNVSHLHNYVHSMTKRCQNSDKQLRSYSNLKLRMLNLSVKFAFLKLVANIYNI